MTSSGGAPAEVRVAVLGPLTLEVGGRAVEVPGSKRRATLAILALAEGRTVPTGDLIDVLWPDEPPDGVTGALQSHVSRIRTHLADAADRLSSVDGGYRLELDADELDLIVARDGLASARRVAEDDPAGAAAELSAVRDLWRGPPLADLADMIGIASRSVALDELRSEIDALLVRCALRAGDVDRALHASTRALAADPRSEPLVRLRMEALAASGRPDEALRAAADLRRRLRTEVGLTPTSALEQLERSIAAGTSVTAQATPAVAATTPAGPGASPPLATTPLVGREAEVGALRRLVDTERLVTIVGAGGLGKTRLAADIARRHDGVVDWVSLAPLSDPDGVARSIADVLGLTAVRGDPLDACARLLATADRLLVLDNCEHLIDGVCDVVSRLSAACPGLTVLTTSRQRLGLPGECAFRLGPLAVPDPSSAHPERAPALAVFLDRARRARPGSDPGRDDLDAAATIVRDLDGVPLAIELAAGRLSFLDVGDLRDRLDRALDLLRGAPSSGDARHHTLRATIAWSYDLLPADRRRLLQHLAVFPDGVDLPTAERVADETGADGDPAVALGHLVDASMLDADLDGRPRYRMLETLRAFALEQLDASGERDVAEQRFLRWAVDLTAWVDEKLHTSEERLADARLREELANLRAAWSLALRRDALDAATSMVVALDDATQWRELPEVWEWAQTLVDEPGLAAHPRRAAALATASDFAWLQGDLGRATELAELALASATDDDGRARALIAAAIARLSRGEFDVAAELALDAAAITSRPEHARLVAALAAAYGGDLDTAAAINATILPPGGNTQQAEWEYTSGELASLAGRHDDAERHYRRAIALASEVGSSFVEAIASVGLLTVLRTTGRHAEALRGYRDVLEYWQHAGNWIQVWTTLRNLAALLIELGDTDTARTLLAAADRAPDAPGVGDSAWSVSAVESPSDDRGPIESVSRRDAVELALAAIERHSRE